MTNHKLPRPRTAPEAIDLLDELRVELSRHGLGGAADQVMQVRRWVTADHLFGHEGDQPLAEDLEIMQAHPVYTHDHATYAEAQRLVSAKVTKAGLVDLVNWLLHRVRVAEHGEDA